MQHIVKKARKRIRVRDMTENIYKISQLVNKEHLKVPSDAVAFAWGRPNNNYNSEKSLTKAPVSL